MIPDDGHGALPRPRPLATDPDVPKVAAVYAVYPGLLQASTSEHGARRDASRRSRRDCGRNSRLKRQDGPPSFQNEAGTLTFCSTFPDLSINWRSILRRPRGPETRPVAVSCGSFASWNCGIASSAARSSPATSVASSGWVPGPGCTASTLIFSGMEGSVSPSSMFPPASRLMRPLQPLRDQLLSRNQPLRASCSVTSSRPEISKNSPLNGSPESNEQEAVPFGSALRILPVSFGNRSASELAAACAPSFTCAASKSPCTSSLITPDCASICSFITLAICWRSTTRNRPSPTS